MVHLWHPRYSGLTPIPVSSRHYFLFFNIATAAAIPYKPPSFVGMFISGSCGFGGFGNGDRRTNGKTRRFDNLITGSLNCSDFVIYYYGPAGAT
jgi:hypothetical protein